jgi:hypothetical protein
MSLRSALGKPKRAAAVALLAAVVPIAAAASASATTSTSGCSVTPLTPVYAYTDYAGIKVLRYDIQVTCNGGRSAQITQQTREEDTFSDDTIGTFSKSYHFTNYGSVTLSTYQRLPDTEWGDEEMYQRVSFRVVSDNGVASGYTSWEKSGVRTFSR